MRTASLALLAAALFTGCDQSAPNFDTPEARETPGIVPLAIGNEWVMEGQQVWPDLPDGTPRPPDALGIDTFRVVGDTLIDGERWFDVKTRAPGGVCHGGWMANRDGNLYSWADDYGATLRAPANLFGPSSVTGQFYGVEGTRTRLSEDGLLIVGDEAFSTVRIELDVERYLSEGAPEAVDSTAREVDEYIRGVGFGVSECSYVRLNDTRDALTLAFTHRYVLTDYTLVGDE